MAECSNKKVNMAECNCSYEQCSRKGCLSYHRKNSELPACFFSARAEKTYDRSIANFLKDRVLR